MLKPVCMLRFFRLMAFVVGNYLSLYKVNGLLYVFYPQTLKKHSKLGMLNPISLERFSVASDLSVSHL